MNAQRREPIDRCTDDETPDQKKDQTAAVMRRLMQQLSNAIDPRSNESTSEQLSRVVAGLTEEERAIFLEAVYANPTSRERIEDLKKPR